MRRKEVLIRIKEKLEESMPMIKDSANKTSYKSATVGCVGCGLS